MRVLNNNSNTAQFNLQKPFQFAVESYIPDLESFFSICELNYALVTKIIDAVGGLDEKGDFGRFGLILNSREMGIVDISLIEKSRYTSSYIFHQIHPTSEWLPGTEFRIQLYHDAKMVEVIQYQRCARLDPVYSYPNKLMYQCDEKQQTNMLLHEWLIFSLANGCQLNNVIKQ